MNVSIEPEVFREMIEEAELMMPFEQLAELVEYWTEPLLELYWDNFRHGEPIDTRCEGQILSYLNALRGVIGAKRFNRAFSLGCINFSGGVLWNIFLYGNDAQRRAATREMKFDRDLDLEDEALSQVWARVRRPIPAMPTSCRQVRRFLQGGGNEINCLSAPPQHQERNRSIHAAGRRDGEKK